MHSTLPPMLYDVEVDKNVWEDANSSAIRYDEADPKTIIGASLNRLIEVLTSVDDYGNSS